MAAKWIPYLDQYGIGRFLVLDVKSETVEPSHARLPGPVMIKLQIEPGDLLYISDSRWWLGGLRSVHLKAGEPHGQGNRVLIGAEEMAAGNLKHNRPVRIEKLM